MRNFVQSLLRPISPTIHPKMDTDTQEKKKRGRGLASLLPGSRSSWGSSPAPSGTAPKQPPLVHGETRGLIRQPASRFSFKLPWGRSKAPAEPGPSISNNGPPVSDTGPPGPDTGPPKQVLTSDDIRERVIQLVHKELGPDTITLDGQANVKNLVGDIQQSVQKRCINGLSRKRMSKILKRVDHYFSIVDVAVQHQPQVATITEIGKHF